MKEKVKKFLDAHFIAIPIYISLACIGIWNSIIALIIYAVIIHILLLLFIVGLYHPNVITLSSSSPIKKALFMAIYTSVTIIILSITKHWYVLCASLSCTFLAFVHLYDEIKNIPGEQRNEKKS